MDFAYLIPGTTEPAITVRRNLFGYLSVLVDGQPAKRAGFGYRIPLPDGTTTELTLGGQWTGLTATVNGVERRIEPRVPPIVTALVFLPLALLAIGGAIGAVVGTVTAGVNFVLSRLPLQAPIKLGAMFAAMVLGVGVSFATASAPAPVPQLALGTCVNGIHEGAQPGVDSYRSVSCSTEHDNEVVGVVEYTGSGAYPGHAALLAFAEQPCLAAFASYVGIDFQASVLQLVAVTPSEVTWARGDRQIGCVVSGPNGLPITSSVKGSAH